MSLNYCAAERLLVRDERVEGVAARDELSGAPFDIRAKMVLNLTGPFAPTLHQRAQGGKPINVPLSRDMAVVIKRRLLPDMGLGIQTRYKDPDAWLSRGNRHLFMAPWRDRTLIGVNSKVYDGDPYKLAVSEAEIQGFVDEIREAAPGLGVTRDDVAVVNAGLLPFGENQPGQKDLSFGKRSVLIDHAARDGLSGLITGMTVRWTMGRLLGEKAMDLACEKLQIAARPSQTAVTPVHGGDVDDRDRLLRSIRADAGSSIVRGINPASRGFIWYSDKRHTEATRRCRHALRWQDPDCRGAVRRAQRNVPHLGGHRAASARLGDRLRNGR